MMPPTRQSCSENGMRNVALSAPAASAWMPSASTHGAKLSARMALAAATDRLGIGGGSPVECPAYTNPCWVGDVSLRRKMRKSIAAWDGGRYCGENNRNTNLPDRAPIMSDT